MIYIVFGNGINYKKYVMVGYFKNNIFYNLLLL